MEVKWRKIDQLAAKCILSMWNEIPDDWRNDEVEYFYLCMIRKLNNDLLEWKRGDE